jgi:hypothetical protein
MNAVAFLSQLRDAGITIDYRGNRLIVEAPTGAVTAKLRAQLVKRKAELIAALETEGGCLREDPPLTEALTETAGLLAIAYRRYAAIQHVGPNRPVISGKDDLANSRGTSVHGVVP